MKEDQKNSVVDEKSDEKIFESLKKNAIENSKVFEDKSLVQRYDKLFWSNLFYNDFIEKCKTGDDDLLFFVKEEST